jgi:3-oxoadipate enol-lactonase
MLAGRPQPTFATLASGVKLHYRIQGNPEGPWMVFINGLLSDTTMWAGVLPLLANDFRILTFDSRGQGKSDAPLDGPYPTALLASEAWELMIQLGIERPILVGLSNGSAMSLELLTTYPDAFVGAVLVSSVPHIDFAMRLRAEHWAHCLEVGGPLLQFDAVAPFLWGDRFLEARHSVLRAYHQVVTGEGSRPHGPLHQIRGIFGWDVRERLALIKAPVLLVCGAEDLLTPPWKCLQTAKLIAHSRLELVPSVGHSYPVEDAKGFAGRIRRAVLEWKAGLAD